MNRTVIPLRNSAAESTLKIAAFERFVLPAACVSAAGQFLAVNGAFGALSNCSVDQLIGRTLLDLAGLAGRDRLARRWARLWDRLRQGVQASAVLRWQPLEGRPLTLHVDAYRLSPVHDDVACIIVRDLTPELAERRARRGRAARLSALRRCCESPGFLLGADRRVLLHNAAAETIRDDRSLAFLGLPFDDFLDEASAELFRDEYERLLAAPGAARVLELRHRAQRDGDGRCWRVALENRLHDATIAAVLATIVEADELHHVGLRLQHAESQFSAIAEHAGDLILEIDPTGVIRYASSGVLRLLGRDPGSVVGQAAIEIVAGEDRTAFAEALQEARGGTCGSPEQSAAFRLTGADGTSRPFVTTIIDVADDPAVGGALLIARVDKTTTAPPGAEALRQTRRLEFRERLLELAIRPRGDFAHVLSRLLRVTAETLQVCAASFWVHNEQASALHCESMFAARQSRFAHDRVGVEFPAALFPAYMARLRARRPLVIGNLLPANEFAALSRHGCWSGVRALLDVPVLIDGEVQGVLSLHHDAPREWDEEETGFAGSAALMIALAMEASQRQQAESRIEQLAWYDPLTGLPNRNLLRETLRDMIATAANRHRRIGLMLIDLDRFKDVNDTLGHLIGDALIKSAAQVLRELVGERGVVGRLGGDEFVVVLNDFEQRQEVALLAAGIAKALHRTDLVPNVDTQVSASIGIALYPEHGCEIGTLMKNADSAMYQAKRDGRNQFSFFDPIRYEHAAREVQLGIQLLKALHGGATQFLVDYQPQVQMASGRVVGLEALIRWQHPDYGRLTPDRFVGVAERSGLSERITRWMINEVCAQILRWRTRQPGFDIPIAINVAGRELGSTSLPAIVRGALERHGIEPRMITLEITERTLVKESEINNDVLAELAAVGVGLVLDDFGTGYSMLGYLKRMPIQALKIDGSFVSGVPGDADSCAIVHAMLAVARHFKLKVVAESVETAEQVEFLRTVGCEFAQGFYYSRPMAPQTILEYIELDPPDPTAAAPH